MLKLNAEHILYKEAKSLLDSYDLPYMKRPKTLNRKTSPPEKTKDPETKKTEKSKT